MNKNLIASLLFAVIALLFFMFLLPQYRGLQGARASLDEREVLLENTKAAQRNILKLDNEYQSNEATIARVLQALPKEEQYDYVTESFQYAANESGVELVSLTVGEGQKGAGVYKHFSIKAEITASYQQLLSFLDTLEHSLRLYDISKLQISKRGTSNSSDQLNIILTGTAYSLQ